MHRSGCLLVPWFLIPIFVLSSLSAELPRVAPLRAQPGLQQLTQRAGLIFSGTVVSVTPERAAGSDQVTSVAITFQVEQAIKGARSGQRLTIHEWAGLWTGGERYRVGERLMLFLHAPSKLGFTSPVGGAAGRFAVDRSGRILLDSIQAQNLRGGPIPVRIDRQRRIMLPDLKRAIRRAAEE